MPHEHEDERLSRWAEWAAGEEEGEIEGRFGPGSYGEHELLDRTHLLLKNWEDFIVDHPSTLKNPAWFDKAMEIDALIARFYSEVGEGH